MRKFIFDFRFIVSFCILGLLASMAAAFILNEDLWVSRFGSLATLAGLLLTIKHKLLSQPRDIRSIVSEMNHLSEETCDKESEQYKTLLKAAESSLRDEKIGLVVTVFGTVIWGYGDWFFSFLH